MLKWKTPRWLRAHVLRRVAAMVFSRGPMLRILATSLLVSAVIWCGARWSVPNLQFDALWQALLICPLVFANSGIFLLVHWGIRGQVTLTEHCLRYSHSNGNLKVGINEIEAARLVVFSAEHLVLKVRPVQKREFTIALPTATDLRLLTSLLPRIEVVDKRTAFAVARTIVVSAGSRARPATDLWL
jgi:hypothetical protein